MSQLADFLYPLPSERPHWTTRLTWWESRRFAFNAVVGAAGLVTLALVRLASIVPPTDRQLSPPWSLVLVYGGLANAAYTLGFVTESTLRLWWKDAPDVAPALFREGIFLSVALTLFPGCAAGGLWVVHAATVLAHWVAT